MEKAASPFSLHRHTEGQEQGGLAAGLQSDNLISDQEPAGSRQQYHRVKANVFSDRPCPTFAIKQHHSQISKALPEARDAGQQPNLPWSRGKTSTFPHRPLSTCFCPEGRDLSFKALLNSLAGAKPEDVLRGTVPTLEHCQPQKSRVRPPKS